MDVLLLGTAGYHPSETRQTTCVLLPEAGIVLDAGTGLFRLREHLATRSLDIFLSHAHLDHIVGLTFLLGVLWQKEIERIRLFGDGSKLAAVRQHLFNEAIFPVAPSFEAVPIVPGLVLDCGAKVTHFPLAHPGGSLGYRFDWPDRSLAYVTDTTAAGEKSPYLEHIRGVDLLLHECNFRDGQEEFAARTGHSTPTPVAKLAAAAQVRKVVLLHFNPLETGPEPVDLSAARRIFPAVTLGRDLLRLAF